ncbi:MAG: sulfotransferase [Methylovulum sp.]|uniref:sulfotransferase family protein n=1 Tax=Methylovulum sp. TaxID=1916980 RepID=UPI00261E14AD|nr:sulfotransferase [Methylovulum sp.]MDD2722871.1 sulfotransferase [Methylovulum sp.]
MIPDFLVIGAQKSGTTWLDRNLRIHPDIWLPPEKEIHFFDFPPLIPFFFLLFAPERPIRHWAKNRMLRDYRKVLAKQQSASWYFRYYFLVRTQRWYISLFTPDSQQMAGEITPRYAIMSEKHIAKVHALMPNGKIIYLLRNPIDRLWSDLAMFHSARFGAKGLHTITAEEIEKFIQNTKHLASSRYTNNLYRWEKFYPPEQIFIGFQDQIRDSPQELIKDIYQFLDVDFSERHISGRIHQRINSHDYPDIPQPFAHALAKLFLADIETLHVRFNNAYTAQWLASTQQALEEGAG